jgi:hypothetical protein
VRSGRSAESSASFFCSFSPWVVAFFNMCNKKAWNDREQLDTDARRVPMSDGRSLLKLQVGRIRVELGSIS